MTVGVGSIVFNFKSSYRISFAACSITFVVNAAMSDSELASWSFSRDWTINLPSCVMCLSNAALQDLHIGIL